MHFVGVTSPAANLSGALAGARRMVERARAVGLAPIVVDTSGLVAGEMGRALKQAKIELLDPDLVVCLQRTDECEPILRPYRPPSRPAVVRLPVHEAVRRRSAEERRRFREDRLRAFFAAAKPLTLDLTQVAMLVPPLFMGSPLAANELERAAAAAGHPLVWAERRASGIVIVTADALTPAEARAAARAAGATLVAHHALAEFQNALAGLQDAQRQTIGVGVVQTIDFHRARLVVDVSITGGEIAAISIGRETYSR
jgi:polynucleotide 5'-hydroxyl-kinase GRC3/NOL9